MKLCWLALLVVGCSGTAVIDGGSGGGSGSTTTSRAAANSTGTGSSRCMEHRDCPGGVCIFSSGTCSTACQAASCDSCTPGTVCEGCATSSCPTCKDCMSACVPPELGQCDDDDACPPDQVCLHRQRQCAPSCTPSGCADPNMVCSECVTSSCCGCENCVSACVPVDF